MLQFHPMEYTLHGHFSVQILDGVQPKKSLHARVL